MKNKNDPKRLLHRAGVKKYREIQKRERIFQRAIDKYLENFTLETDEDYDALLEKRQQLELELQYLKNPLYFRYEESLKKFIQIYKTQLELKHQHAIKVLLKQPSLFEPKKYLTSLKHLDRLIKYIFNSCNKNHIPTVNFLVELQRNFIDMRELNGLYEKEKNKFTKY